MNIAESQEVDFQNTGECEEIRLLYKKRRSCKKKPEKKRLSIRLVNRMKIKPEAEYKLYLDFGVTCRIDFSDWVGVDAACMVKRGLLEYIGVEKDRLFADAVENSVKIRPAVWKDRPGTGGK